MDRDDPFPRRTATPGRVLPWLVELIRTAPGLAATYGHALSVINISTPTAPAFAGILPDATNLANPNDVAVSGHYAYVANQTTPIGECSLKKAKKQSAGR